MVENTAPVHVLGSEEVPAVVEVLRESFFDYPVMRWVLGEESDYLSRLERLIYFFTMARVYRDEVLLGVRGVSGLSGVALVAYPGTRQSPDELSVLREDTWEDLGPEARLRYEAFGAASAPFEVDAAHIHLSLIGTTQSSRGQGIGRLLMNAVHDLSKADERSTGVTLTTEVEENLLFYRRFGYEIVGRAEVSSTLTSWGLFRRDPDRVGEAGTF